MEGKELRISTANAGRVSKKITVESGALRFTGSSSNKTKCNGNNIILVEKSGKVYGSNALFHAIQASDGGVFSITGTSDLPTTITTSENATNIIKNGAVLDFKLNSADKYSFLNCKGTLTFYDGGILRVRLGNGFTPAAGTEFKLWTANTVSGVTAEKVVLDLPVLPAGLKWDTTSLYDKEGVLRVVKDDASSIDSLPADAAIDGEVFTADGKCLGRITTTKANLHRAVKALVGARGSYVVRTQDANGVVIIK